MHSNMLTSRPLREGDVSWPARGVAGQKAALLAIWVEPGPERLRVHEIPQLVVDADRVAATHARERMRPTSVEDLVALRALRILGQDLVSKPELHHSHELGVLEALFQVSVRLG